MSQHSCASKCCFSILKCLQHVIRTREDELGSLSLEGLVKRTHQLFNQGDEGIVKIENPQEILQKFACSWLRKLPDGPVTLCPRKSMADIQKKCFFQYRDIDCVLGHHLDPLKGADLLLIDCSQCICVINKHSSAAKGDDFVVESNYLFCQKVTNVFFPVSTGITLV